MAKGEGKFKKAMQLVAEFDAAAQSYADYIAAGYKPEDERICRTNYEKAKKALEDFLKQHLS